MAVLKRSELLEKLLRQAETLAKENECSTATRDHIIAAAIRYVQSSGADGEPGENDQLKKVVSQALGTGISADALLSHWRGKTVPSMERTLLVLLKNKVADAAEKQSLPTIPADLFLSMLIKESTAALRTLTGGEKPAKPPDVSEPGPDTGYSVHQPGTESRTEAEPVPAQPADIATLVQQTKELQTRLDETVLGQAHAVSSFIAGYFQAELQAMIEKNRERPRGTFLFAGPPGVGKTFLAQEAARELKLPFRRYDMSEYSNANAVDELAGSDKNYKASAEGQLTGFVAKNPRCVILLDEIEKASLDVIHLFLQVLDAGRLRDNHTDHEVSFGDAILIFTTNAGRELYENSDVRNLSTLSRDTILDALGRDLNPKTKEPLFPAAICSRFASGNVVMFNHLEAHILRTLIEKRLAYHSENLHSSAGVSIETDEAISTALLLAEGASADARMVKGRADAFFGGELYELFRNLTSPKIGASPSTVKSIHVGLDVAGMSDEIAALFTPQEPVHALVFSGKTLLSDTDSPDLPVFHYVHTAEDAKAVIKRNPIQMILCDYTDAPTSARMLNREDMLSDNRTFLLETLSAYPDIPILLLEAADNPFSKEEKDSYLHRGVQGFISVSDDRQELVEQLVELVNRALQQNSLTSLARANKLLTYDTYQQLSDDGESARITLFDMRLKTAVKAEDTGNVLSMLSRPDVRFDDVIGADSAKDELRYYCDYIRNPWKYLTQGAPAPKGILLYGPPGTGKTMLAKAFAAEVNAAFIATEGNRFFKGIVGQGAEMVHKLFAAARRYAPSVLFIDEIDAIARSRTGRDTDLAQDSEQILTALFAEMDGFSTNSAKPVIVLGATNYGISASDRLQLDAAMLRRFDRRILIDLPAEKDRKQFLTNEIRQKRGQLFQISDAMIDSLSERSTGMSLAQLTSVVDMALRNSLRKSGQFIDDAMLEEAFETFVSGDKKQWDAETILRTARHEAGHALLSWLGGEKPSYVTIVSRGDHGGYMQHATQEDKFGYTRAELLARIRTALGGRAAELVCYGPEDGVTTGASGDLKTATSLAQRMLCTYGMVPDFGLAVVEDTSQPISKSIRAQVNMILQTELENAVSLLTASRAMLDKLVEELRKRNSLNGKELDDLLTGMEGVDA